MNDMNHQTHYAYPAIFDIGPSSFTVRFPDLPVDPVTFDKSEIANAFDVMAQILGNYVSECLMFDTPLPEPTDLKTLELTPDEKGVMIEISQA